MILHLVPTAEKYSETFIWNLIRSVSQTTRCRVLFSEGNCSLLDSHQVTGKDTNQLQKVRFKLLSYFHGGSFFNLSQLNEHIKKAEPKVVHAHFGYFIKDIAFIRKHYPNIKCIMSFHGTDINSVIRSSKGLRTALQELSQDEGVVFTFPSEFLKRAFLEIISDSRAQLKVISNSVESRFVKCWQPTDNTVFSVLSVARLEEVKGIKYLISAAKLIAESNISLKVRVVGEGSCRAELEAFISRSGLRNSFELVGKKSRDEIIDYIRTSDVYVQPSITLANGQQESFGVSALEAAVSGIPIIVTDSGGLSNTIEDSNDNHFIVPEKSAQALANLIISIIQNNKFIEPSDEYINRFSEESLLKIWLSLYCPENHKCGAN
ncbi:glycosyltransferase family 4 protein [Pseudoalteromonas luteoviolacea]|uniref:Glycosyl transferase family 1 domain-containing protein n=1 Tax=Pseudoalteromonas luteoviolacea H33 TaxID=1365251 RepID=A0A167EYR6_9GAMM|nr:glycosyltransferase family 4 protein [Pseudoalteromonas luteoviolacea]KZN51374.1 hypothetical protein N476_13380 [Pseudoalteromonas luteoviolacea H33]KZN71455.1 hypothetical protein N477_04040 [Pseudoalteromonas luteoviolacea H33-S]MBQ4876810.1 glycosyltransferase family 4 protein [Pseudoalteromonas luteoviolacea]MBQ4905401.1 glycosyltransferase family 4 protein [Pseudoalteromonas luteoviolacea]